MIIDFQSKLQERQEKESMEAKKHFFQTFIKPYLTAADKEALLEAIATNDLQAYEAITKPILMRQIIKKMSKEGGAQ